MRKTIVAINITLDGYCDHTAGIADDELHEHFAKILETTDTTMMGRVTYQMMEDYWPEVAKNKTGSKAEIRFAEQLERLERFVVSKTLKEVSWENTVILRDNILGTVRKLKQENGKDILIGGPTLISYLARANLIDEYYFVIQPFVLGKGITLFTNLPEQINLELIDTHPFASGVIATHYQVISKES